MKNPLSRLRHSFRDRPADSSLVILLVILFVIFVSVMFLESVEKCLSGLLGLCEKSEILKFLGIGMGGVLVALQAVASHRRAKAMEEAAKAQAGAANAQARATEEQANANQNAEQGQRQERLKNAIEHLGHASGSMRLGGAYELFSLAQDTPELRQIVLDILCAHIRQTTGESAYQEKDKSKPSEEVQSLLTLLFVQDHGVFKGLRINLQGSWLRGANLSAARLEGAMLAEAHLQEADLSQARLQKANLHLTRLQKAALHHAHLQGTDLRQARLQKAALHHAHLQGAVLFGTQLQGAVLFGTQLQGAVLFGTQLQGADLRQAQLQGSHIAGAYLQGALVLKAQLQGVRNEAYDDSSFEERIMDSIDQKSDLSGVTFEGGLTQEDLKSLAEDLSPEEVNELEKRLEQRVGKPETSGIVTGVYTMDEAKKWIAEYKKAMAEVPGVGDN